MGRNTVVLGIMVAALTCTGCVKKGRNDTAAVFKTSLKTDNEKLGYALGINMGTKIKEMPGSFDFSSVMQGIQDAYYGKKQLLSPEEGKKVTEAAWEREKTQRLQEYDALKVKNLNDAKAFLQANKTAPNVITTASGLQYIVLREGTGPKPKKENNVGVNFKANFLDGKEFDSSEKRKGAIIYSVAAAMPGIGEALQLMPVGSKWRLYLPPELAWGEKGMPRQGIGPNMLLIYEIDLLSIEK